MKTSINEWFFGLFFSFISKIEYSFQTGLAHACANGFMNIIKQLKPQFGLDVNLSDNEGNSPLIFAAQAGHHEIVRYLLNNFSTLKIDQRNRQGFY